jgi:hypothetical protein
VLILVLGLRKGEVIGVLAVVSSPRRRRRTR